MKKDTFLHNKSKRLESAVSEVISVDYPRYGAFACLQNISVTDETTSPTRIDIGFLRGASFIPVKSFAAPAIGFTVTRESDLWTFIDDQPACRIVGGVVGDLIQIVIGGYILFESTGS